MANLHVPILIIGGGLTGAALMLALEKVGYSALLVEAKPFSQQEPKDLDARSLALAPSTERILKMLDIWPLLEKDAESIEMIHVSERHAFGSARLRHEKNMPLGYVIEIQHINRALHQLINPKQMIAPALLTQLNETEGTATIQTADGELTIQADLIVAADGTQSTVRNLCHLPIKTKDYGQHAIAANIELARDHNHQAYERFTTSGPLALLPMTQRRASLVWALAPSEAERLASVSESVFINDLQTAFGYRLGRFINVGKRAIYPLKQIIMPSQVKDRVVFLGNAAHTLHPVAGQGFNLGLRDVAALAQGIAQQGLGADMLESYLKSRRDDHQAITRFTDGLIGLFDSKLPGMGVLRGVGLIGLDNTTFLKNLLARYARGFAGITPDLVCGIALDKDTVLDPQKGSCVTE